MPLMPISMKLAALYGFFSPTQRGGLRVAHAARAMVPQHQWQSQFITPTGLALDLDLATYPDVAMAAGVYEMATLRVLKRLLGPGKHFVDCGANLGYFSLLASRLVGKNGRVDAFEPDPQNRERLLKNILANEASNVAVHAMACGDRTGTITLHHPAADAGNHGQSSTLARLAPGGTSSEVPLRRVEDVVDRVPDVVKIDVEGAELDALRGMSSWLASKTPPKLIIEHNPVTSAAAGFGGAGLFNLLRELMPGCRVRWIGFRANEFTTAGELQACEREGNLLVARASSP